MPEDRSPPKPPRPVPPAADDDIPPELRGAVVGRTSVPSGPKQPSGPVPPPVRSAQPPPPPLPPPGTVRISGGPSIVRSAAPTLGRPTPPAVVRSGAPPVPPAAPAAPPPPPAPRAPRAEELSDADVEEIQEFEVVDPPAGPTSVVPVAPDAKPAWQHKDPHARTVLVVEDDASIRTMIVRGLGMQFTVYEADDGETAMSILARIPQPACIISDWMMPRMDGLALIKALKAHPKLKGTPVLLLTAKHAPMAVLEGINAGARGYIAKPFKLKELQDKVTSVIGKK